MATRPTSVIVKLDEPVQLGTGGKKISEVTIRKPGVGALRNTKLSDLVQADTNTMLLVLPRITDPTIPGPILETMDPADFTECCNQVVGFLQQRGPSTDSPAE